jgi:hypothetical protein
MIIEEILIVCKSPFVISNQSFTISLAVVIDYYDLG